MYCTASKEPCTHPFRLSSVSERAIDSYKGSLHCTSMPPTFKKAKEFDPALAGKTLHADVDGTGQGKGSGDLDDRQALLIALGLADEAEVAQDAPSPKTLQDPQLEQMSSGRIGAFYPDDGHAKAATKSVYDALRARLEATTDRLLQGQLGEDLCEEVQELLLEQQHQIDLLLRGQSSLRGSMNSLRRSTMEKDAKTKLLHEQLQEQHGAALKEMEAKLEKAIEQVQLLQQTTRQRQQQQSATLQSTSEEVSQLRSTADKLQAALQSKEQELQQTLQLQERLRGELQREQSAQEVQHSRFNEQLQELAADCQAALGDAQVKAAALAAAQADCMQLSKQLQEAREQQQALDKQLEEAKSQQLELTTQNEQLQAQVQHAAAMSQQQQAMDASTQQELMSQVAGLQDDLEKVSAAKQQVSEQVVQLEQQCRDLSVQLEQSRAETQECRAELALVHKQQASTSDEAAGKQQELVAAVQAKTELAVQLDQATESMRELRVKQQSAEAALQDLKQRHAAAESTLVSMLQEKQERQQQLQELSSQHTATAEASQKLQGELAGVQAALQVARQQAEEHRTKLVAAEAKMATTEADAQQLQWKISSLQTELQKVQRTSSATIQQLRQEADAAKQQLSTVQALADKQVAKAQAAAAEEVALYRQRWRDEFDKRRKLHNQVIELKGNIRVLARIRPLIEKERSAACSAGGSAQEAVRVTDEETLLLESANGPRVYDFDRVFGPSDGQAQVYEEVSAIVTSILDGYNACIMAYGQTGSGKTYTIEGPADDPGINNRALAELFAVAKERSAEVSYTLSASVLEIYQDQIFDLLTGNKDTGDKLDIKEGPQGLYIPNLRIEAVNGPEDVAAVLQKGKQNRSTFATNMNEHSSRSHLVLSLYVTAKHLTKDTVWSSKLHLIDLAGSERVSRSGAEGDRLKEAAAINKSLSALGDVVSALQQRSSHVPYRNSKLTRLLEDSLGGSSKTLLVVNCSPASENVGETKCSLDFATRTRKVELGAAVKVTEWSGGGTCSSPSSLAPRDSSFAGSSPTKASQASLSSSSGGTGSASNSPRMSGRFSAGPNELRQSASKRAAGTMHRDEK